MIPFLGAFVASTSPSWILTGVLGSVSFKVLKKMKMISMKYSRIYKIVPVEVSEAGPSFYLSANDCSLEDSPVKNNHYVMFLKGKRTEQLYKL